MVKPWAHDGPREHTSRLSTIFYVWTTMKTAKSCYLCHSACPSPPGQLRSMRKLELTLLLVAHDARIEASFLV